MLGGRVEQYFALIHNVPVQGEWGEHEDRLYAERIQVQSPGVKVLMRYGKSNGWLDGSPAAITRKVGRGTITYIGVWMDDAGMERAAQWMLSMSGVHPDFPPVPKGIEVGRRVGPRKTIYIFENFATGPQTISLPSAMTDVLAGGVVHSITLPVYGVAVLEQKSGGSRVGK
jgi:beta-galactosidase